MPILSDISIVQGEDAIITIPIIPSTPVGGWSVRFGVQKRYGGISGVMPDKTCASGFIGNVSGMTVVNSGQGIFSVRIYSSDTASLDFGAYVYAVERTNSGFNTCLSEGYLQIGPTLGF